MQVFQLLTLLAAAAVVVLADDPKVETPTSAAIAGVPLQIKWNGGSGPFTVVVNTFESGKQTDVIKTATNVNSAPWTYKPPSSAVGKPIQFDVTDSTGAMGQSGATKAVVAGSGGLSEGDSSGSSSGSSNAAGASAAASSTSAAEASSDSSKSNSSSKDGSKDGSKSSGATSIRGTTASVAALTGAAVVAAAALL